MVFLQLSVPVNKSQELLEHVNFTFIRLYPLKLEHLKPNSHMTTSRMHKLTFLVHLLCMCAVTRKESIPSPVFLADVKRSSLVEHATDGVHKFMGAAGYFFYNNFLQDNHYFFSARHGRFI